MERIFENVLWSMKEEQHVSGDDQKQGRWACSHQDLTENGFPDRILTSPHQPNFLCFLVEYSELTALLASPQQLLVLPFLTETPPRSPLTWRPAGLERHPLCLCGGALRTPGRPPPDHSCLNTVGSPPNTLNWRGSGEMSSDLLKN